jgi:hypothetical protein
MSSKAAKRRKRRITLPGGQSIPQRITGRDRPPTHQPQEDARMTALTARARHNGITLDDAKAPWHGCAAGRAMALTSAPADHLALWGAICHMRATYAAYWRHNGIPSPYATCLRILAPTSTMEATADSPPPDDRDEATKARQATSAMMRIEGALQSVGATTAKRIILGDHEPSAKDALLMVAGLRAIMEGL